MTSANPATPRIVSMDQFRGYTVAGMFLVNFLGGLAAIHPVFRHNDTYFSYADSIMPSFMFAVGFSFRLSYLRRRSKQSAARTTGNYVRRSLALVLVSLVMYGFGGGFQRWTDFERMPDEFEPFRLKAPASESFQHLMAKGAESRPGASERETVQAAAQIGAMLNSGPPANAAAKAQFEIAQQAARLALAEGHEFVAPAVAREKRWQAQSSSRKLLVHFRIFGARLLKSDLWETLAIIGVSQLVVLPWIGCRFITRFGVLVALGVLNVWLAYGFNWDFVYGINDNWMAKLWMTGTSRSWDGGFFGVLQWSVAMLAGTLAHDIVIGASSRATAARRLVAWGLAFMLAGYAMSCLTRLYELSPRERSALKDRSVRQDAEKTWLLGVIQHVQRGDRSAARVGFSQPIDPATQASRDQKRGTVAVLNDQLERFPNLELAENPVWPSWERLKGRSLRELLVEPPFVAPPRDNPRTDSPPLLMHRQLNYWMMGKRMPSLSFITFGSGFAFALYGLFVAACDGAGLTLGLFRTFGANALAAYFLHHVVELAVRPLVPADAALWYCLAGFLLFFLITYLCVRFLEKRKIFLKL